MLDALERVHLKPKTKKKKDLSIQAFRGLAIIAVVVNHSIDAFNYFDIRENFFQQNGISFLLAQSVNFAVPLFFFISGYFAHRVNINSFSEYTSYCRKKLSRILIPYLFWSLFTLVVFESMYGWNFSEISVSFLTGSIQSPYYFLIVLSQLILLTPLLISCSENRLQSAAWMTVTPCAVALLYLSKFVFDYSPKFKFFAPLFCFWISFYFAGILFAKNKSIVSWLERHPARMICVCMTMFFLSCAESLGLYWYMGGSLVSQLRFLTIFFSVSLILSFFAIKNYFTSWPSVLVKLGEYSFGIYLIHSMFLPLMSRLLIRIGFLENNQILIQVSIVVSVLLACMCSIFILRKILGVGFSRRYLGFG